MSCGKRGLDGGFDKSSGKGGGAYAHDSGKGQHGAGYHRSRGAKGGVMHFQEFDKGQGKGGYHRRGELPTLQVVTEHMNYLLGLPDADRAACGACVAYEYTREQPAPALPPISGSPSNTIFGTIEMDTFQAGAALLEQGWPQPAVLNMANEHNCGGAWCQKPGSQEEDLLRCSTLPLALWPRRLPSDQRMPEFDMRLPRADEGIYPFTEACVVYTPTVVVCRSRQGQQLPPSRQCVVSVVSSAAQDLRSEKRHYRGPFDAKLTTQKMRSMLWAAVHHGHTALVLGAYGCGAFRNDPRRVAQLYWRLLGPGGEFHGRFSIVTFAIIKSTDNLQAFSAVFPWMRIIPPPERVMAEQPLAMPTVKTSLLTDGEKDVLKLAKKIREALKLEESVAAGETLIANQRQKLSRKAEWVIEFSALMASLSHDSVAHTKVQDVLERVNGCHS